ncbi:MAG: DNA polymerase III subunit delta' [Streptosporangiales bacterium]|nr:DNA polymerase III subunit delta' [Streptosporangiales bacterium]
MSVFDDLVGQTRVVEQLTSAVRAAGDLLRGGPGKGMTHAWLFTGPPGSGRSTAARAFAAALLCPDGGCGHCDACHQALTGNHADVELVRPSGLSYGVKETRALVLRAASVPTGGRFQIVLFEDADRATEQAANALLKAIEEPPPRTVWLLCAPSPDDLVVTIRSRCRLVTLGAPSPAAVADVLIRRDGIEPELAHRVAAASQGHIGRARRLATDAETSRHRDEVLGLPSRLTGIAQCVDAAAKLVAAAEGEATATTDELNDSERSALRQAFGEGSTGRGVAKALRGSAGAMKELEDRQKSRATRIKRDSLDLALMDLTAYYRDVLALQVGAQVALSAGDREPELRHLAGSSTPDATLRRIEAIMQCRERLQANANPQLAVEAMMMALRTG